MVARVTSRQSERKDQANTVTNLGEDGPEKKNIVLTTLSLIRLKIEKPNAQRRTSNLEGRKQRSEGRR